MVDFEILSIDRNNVAESYNFDEPKEAEFIHNFIWEDYKAGMKVSRFYNYFVQAVFSYFMLSE